MRGGKNSNSPLRNSCGFSFIELVVVLVITSVLISVASPQLSRFYKGVKLDSAARQLKYFLQHANEVALSERTPCRIKIGKDWRALALYLRKEGGKTGELIRVETGLHSHEIMPELEISGIEKDKTAMTPGSELHIEVFPLFSPQETVFSLKDAAGNKAKVKIEAGSGKVVILE